jgi:hypothetical protein
MPRPGKLKAAFGKLSRAVRHLRGSDFRWAIAFVLPYVAVFSVFVVYPFGYALWMARKPSLYADLIADPFYLPTVVNTLLFVGLGVNVKMFLALLLSGFFLRPRWWIRALLAVYSGFGSSNIRTGHIWKRSRARRRPDGRRGEMKRLSSPTLLYKPPEPPHRRTRR